MVVESTLKFLKMMVAEDVTIMEEVLEALEVLVVLEVKEVLAGLEAKEVVLHQEEKVVSEATEAVRLQKEKVVLEAKEAVLLQEEKEVSLIDRDVLKALETLQDQENQEEAKLFR